ncbi:unknown [Prevotella sp. CAG:592]|nr:unknown [Prevotella sp. CAG:592]
MSYRKEDENRRKSEHTLLHPYGITKKHDISTYLENNLNIY